MVGAAVHNPDEYIADLRLILSQGKKRVALLIGAGASAAIKDPAGAPLIPMIAELTSEVLAKLEKEDKETVALILKEFATTPTIEETLSKLRLLARALGTQTVFGVSGEGFNKLANRICDLIGQRVNVSLPTGQNPYSHLTSWIAGTSRTHGVEIFTPNYDLLFEEALERAKVPYFDGFSGGVQPFFDAATVSNDELPARWTRVWKLHGSLGWATENGQLVRTQSRKHAHLIYPDHLKFDQTQKQPYAALFDRLRNFLRTPDSLLITCGFSFRDAHIVSTLEEALAAYPFSAVVALQYQELSQETLAVAIAEKRPNLSVYGADAAVINGVKGKWRVGSAVNEQWLNIRQTFWATRASGSPSVFTLGGFNELTQFLALSASETVAASELRAAAQPTLSNEAAVTAS